MYVRASHFLLSTLPQARHHLEHHLEDPTLHSATTIHHSLCLRRISFFLKWCFYAGRSSSSWESTRSFRAWYAGGHFLFNHGVIILNMLIKLTVVVTCSGCFPAWAILCRAKATGSDWFKSMSCDSIHRCGLGVDAYCLLIYNFSILYFCHSETLLRFQQPLVQSCLRSEHSSKLQGRWSSSAVPMITVSSWQVTHHNGWLPVKRKASKHAAIYMVNWVNWSAKMMFCIRSFWQSSK